MMRLTVCRAVAVFSLAVVASVLSRASATSIPATVQAIRIPAENLDPILPGGLDMETTDYTDLTDCKSIMGICPLTPRVSEYTS